MSTIDPNINPDNKNFHTEDTRPVEEKSGSIPAQPLPSGEDAKAHKAKRSAEFSSTPKTSSLFSRLFSHSKQNALEKNHPKTMQKLKAFLAPIQSKVNALNKKAKELSANITKLKEGDKSLYELDAQMDKISDMRDEINNILRQLENQRKNLPEFFEGKSQNIRDGRNAINWEASGSMNAAEKHLQDLEKTMIKDEVSFINQMKTYAKKLHGEAAVATPEEARRIIEKCDKRIAIVQTLIQENQDKIRDIENKYGTLDQINTELKRPLDIFFENTPEKEIYEQNLQTAKEGLLNCTKNMGNLENIRDHLERIKATAEK